MTSLASQIFRAPESIFYQTISQLQPQWVEAAWVGVDATLAHAQTASPYFNRNLYLHRIFSNVVNTGWWVWDIAVLATALSQKRILYPSISMLPIVGSGFLLHLIGNRLRQKTLPIDPLPERLKNAGVTLSYTLPDSPSYSQAIYLTRIVVNAAIACLSSQHRIWAGLNVLGLSYSFLKNWQVKWLKISRTFSYPKVEIAQGTPKHFYTDRLQFDYLVPLFPNQNSQCSICLQDNPLFSYCFPHAPLDLDCIVAQIFQQSEKFRDGLKLPFSYKEQDAINKFLIPFFQWIRYGHAKDTTYKVHFNLPQTNLPKCPECSNYPPNHDLEGEYFDQNASYGRFTTTVTLTPDPRIRPMNFVRFDTLWARIGALYSISQSALALMQQRHPDIAVKIAWGQKIFAFFDLASVMYSYKKLYHLLYEKYVIKKAEQGRSQDRLNQAQDAHVKAMAEYDTTKKEIKTAIKKGEMLSIYQGPLIPLSKLGRALIKELNKKVETQDILELENSIEIKTPTGEEFMNRFKEAFKTGEIIATSGYIPLTPASVLVCKKFMIHLNQKTIEADQTNGWAGTTEDAKLVLAEIKTAIEHHECAVLNNGFLPLSMEGKQTLEQFLKARDEGKIFEDDDGEFIYTEDVDWIRQNVIDAFNNIEILDFTETKFIPLTSEAKNLLKQAGEVEENYDKTDEELEEAKEEAKQTLLSLQKKYHAILQMSMVSGSAILAAASFLSVSLLHKKLKSTIDLTQLLKNVTSPADFKNMKIRWSMPWVPYLVQCLMAHRCFVNIAMAIFSPDKKVYTLSALSQVATLYNLAQLPYVKLERTFFNLVKNVSRIDVSFDMLLPLFHPLKSRCSSLSSHLESNLKVVYKYTTQFLNNSSWTCWLRKIQGVHTDTYYDVNLQSTSSLHTCSCKIQTIFERITASARDARYGYASIRFFYPAA